MAADSRMSTGHLNAPDPLLSRLDDLFFAHFGEVFIRKEHAPDVLTPAGFHQLEGDLLIALSDATAVAREEAADGIRAAVAQASVYQSKPGYLADLVALIALIYARLRDRTLTATEPILTAAMLDMAQRTVDAWYLAGTGPAWTLNAREQDTVRGLRGNHSLFIGYHFGTRLPAQTTARLQAMLDSVDAPRLLPDDLGDQLAAPAEDSDAYWLPVAVAALTQARSYGGAGQFRRAGTRWLTYYNPLDEHTTAFCRDIAGTSVKVSTVLDHLERLSRAESVESVQNLAPFVTSKNGVYTVERGGVSTSFTAAEITPQKLEQLGTLAPPFHNHCRTLLLPEEEESP